MTKQKEEIVGMLHSILGELRVLTGNAANREENASDRVIEIRDISDEQASEEILALFRKSETHLYYSDIEESLGIDIDQVIKVCDKLMETGKIAVDEAD